MKKAYLSLGSNLGDRQAHLDRALELLEQAGVRVLRRSSIFETEPQDVLQQPWFLNVVAEVETSLFPKQLLACLLRTERELGRKRLVPKGPRIIDIDILLYGNAEVATKELQIPHPRLWQRRFVLEPLAELAPDIRDRTSGKGIREYLRDVQNQAVRKWQV